MQAKIQDDGRSGAGTAETFEPIKTKTGELVPMPCPACAGLDGVNRISMSLYNSNGFRCSCGFEVGYP